MNHQKGFTRLELLVVLLILSVLTAIAVPRISRCADLQKRNSCKMNVALINSQIELYHNRTGEWPLNLNTLDRDEWCFQCGVPTCPFGTPYQYNQQTHHVVAHDHD